MLGVGVLGNADSGGEYSPDPADGEPGDNGADEPAGEGAPSEALTLLAEPELLHPAASTSAPPPTNNFTLFLQTDRPILLSLPSGCCDWLAARASVPPPIVMQNCTIVRAVRSRDIVLKSLLLQFYYTF